MLDCSHYSWAMFQLQFGNFQDLAAYHNSGLFTLGKPQNLGCLSQCRVPQESHKTWAAYYNSGLYSIYLRQAMLLQNE